MGMGNGALLAQGRRAGGAAATAALVVLLVAAGITPASAQAPDDGSGSGWSPTPVDPQQWVDQADLTWDDFTSVPNQPPGWREGSIRGTEEDYRGAVVLLDFIDQPFLITQAPEAHPFGNPQPGWEQVPQAGVRQWMEDYLNVPNEYNGGQSITGYWMEDTHGRFSTDLTAFGPYTLPGKLHEYGLAAFAPVTGPDSRCPLGDVCNKNLRTDGLAQWRASEGATIDSQFDFIFYVSAAHDESSTWQEQGEMIFQTRDDVPAAFGPPGAGGATPPLNNFGMPMPNWSPTRYVPWTSWRASANHWPNAGGGSSTQAESSGQSVYAHEFSHIRGLPDNYNNPFADNIRNYTGYWEMMSRGTFNGPGGTHSRWQVPNQGGSGLGPHHMLHFKRQLGVVAPDEQVLLDRNSLVDQGIAVARLKARSSVPDGDQVGLLVTLGAGGYQSGQCEGQTSQPSFWCPPGTNWATYSMEVIDRVGNDSFTPSHGVLLAQNRSSGTPRVWLIDANPQDIDMIDFYRPDGTPVPVVRGDPRQLNDATWHAGTDSGSEFEYVESFNRLHFYILDAHRDADGVLSYDVAVRNLDGAGPFARGVELGAPATTAADASTLLLEVPLSNTGEAGGGLFGSDVYRLAATVEGAGWDVWLPHEVRAAAAGGTVPAQVYATAGEGASETAVVTLTATSEADPTVSRSIAVEVGTVADGSQDTVLSLVVEGRGSARTLVAHLAPASEPTGAIAQRVIVFHADDGTALGQSTTGPGGVATLLVAGPYRAPNRQFTAHFAGDDQWAASSASTGG